MATMRIMREDINFKGANRESDFWLISELCPGCPISSSFLLKLSHNLEVGKFQLTDCSLVGELTFCNT